MNHWMMRGAAAVVLAGAASTAPGLTADEAWERWQSAAAAFDQTLTAESETRDGAVLTLSGVEIVTDHGTGSFSGRIEEIVLSEQDDGTVRMTLSDVIPIVATDMSNPSEKIVTEAILRHSDLVAIASGDADATEFGLSAARLSIAVEEMRVNDEPFPMTLSVDIGGLLGDHRQENTDGGSFASDISAETSALEMTFADAESQTAMTLMASMADLSSQSTGTTVSLESAETPGASILAGLTSSGTASYGPSSFALDMSEADETIALNGAMDGGIVRYAVNGDMLMYDIGYDAIALTASGSSIPLPELALSLARAAFMLEMPVSAEDTPAPFAVKVALEDLAIDEALWAMVDPAGILPRDPARLMVDLSGTARMLANLFDPDALARVEATGMSPGQIETLDVNALSLAAIGAQVDAEGGFAFDNSDLQTFNGMPRPSGALDLSVTGLTDLIENLTRMGVIPNEQIMVVRMMLGMLAKPGNDPGELVSRIEITPEGQIRVNGAPMPMGSPF